MSTNDVARCWQDEPHPILLATGLIIDVLEAHEPLDSEQLRQVGPRGPVATLPNGHRLYFLRTSRPPVNGSQIRGGRYHGAGSWVPLPPTLVDQQPVAWQVDPISVGWRPYPHKFAEDAARPTQPRQPSRQPAPPDEPRPDAAGLRRPPPQHTVLLVASGRPLTQITQPRRGAA